MIAGPIVRYETIEKELDFRKHSFENFSYGVRRFTIGLAKKVLIANMLGELCNKFIVTDEKSILFYWIFAISYMLQIYFDFSAYSDMAIGLGRIFGFHFLENFNYPYISKSITEFWRRWHISLSSWLRDYIYIPLGGNRKGFGRKCINTIIVFAVCGIWHGAGMHFVVWGLLHGVYSLIDSVIRKKGWKMPFGGQPSAGAWVYLSYGNGRDPDRSDTKCSGNIRAYYVRDHNYYSGNHISLFCG